MSEVSSYSLDAIIDSIDVGSTERSESAAAMNRGALLTQRALDRLSAIASAAEGSLPALVSQNAEIVKATRITARLTALKSDPTLSALAAAVERASPGIMEASSAGVRSAAAPDVRSSASFGPVADSALIDFERALTLGARDQRQREHGQLQEIVQSAMRDVGYEPRAPRVKGSGSVITARNKAGQTVVIQLDAERGQLAVDFAGFGGTACTLDGQKLTDRLRARGLVARRIDRRIHGDPDGGQLVRETVPNAGAAAVAERARVGPDASRGRGNRTNG